MRVGVLMGGWNSEREVSMDSGRNVADCLKRAGYDAVPLMLDSKDKDEKRFAARLKKARLDAAFVVLHGGYGEDGGVQTLLERLDIPYTGSGPLACGLAMHKGCSKLVFEANDVPTAPWQAWHRKEFKPSTVAKELKLKLPVVVKPADSGSAVGITIVRKPSEILKAFKVAFKESDWVMVEKFVSGVEITVGVLGREGLPVVEIVPKNDFYDYDAKYTPGKSDHIIPARLSSAVRRKAQAIAVAAGEALGCTDYYRVDLIVPKKGLPQVLEVNTVPGFTGTSLFPESARAAGVSDTRLMRTLMSMAMKKKVRCKKNCKAA
jgi:D-alanine-D-alanine ligase